ncbi:hypothetical protein [Aliikangiella sp. IMCC44359]|uniref:hypothetical protein n=1 Tax=Aliikangiella sp. IMCC44359 TaxID=3459125 RepID=UPI00403B1FF0
MKNFSKSPFEGFRPPNATKFGKAAFCIAVEGIMFLLFYSVYNETISFMGETYLSELPLIGGAFQNSDATASNIIAIVLSLFTLLTPIYIFAEIIRQNLIENFREWIAHPSHKITAIVAVFILLLATGLEIINIYTMVAKEALPQGGFVQVQSEQGDVMSYLAENKGIAVGVSLMITIINLTIAYFTVYTFSNLSSQEA